jgi:glycolate oxidase FAD binding subunit
MPTASVGMAPISPKLRKAFSVSVTDALPLLETISATDLSTVVETVAGAAASPAPVYPIGGGTRLGYGVRPKQPGLGLSLARMTALVDYPARDLTVTVEAGMTVAELARRLAAQRQWLPLDVPRPDRSTLGGLIAANTFGPRRYRWGTIRDYLLGFTAVDGRGQPFSGGGRVVKNAAGYNMARLLVGSLGSLAVITQVTLMVRPIPETSALVVADLGGFDRAEPLFGSLARTKTLPSAIQWLLGPAWRQLPGIVSQPQPGLGRLLVGLEGTQAEVDWMIGQLQREWKDAGGGTPMVISGPSSRDLWTALAEGLAGASPENGHASLLLQAQVPPARVVGAVRSLMDADPQASIQAYAGDGILCGRLAPGRLEPVAAFCRRLRASLAALEGSLVVLESPAEAELSRETVWGPPGDGQRVMESLKRQFDPQGILNPGRFIFAHPPLLSGEGRGEGDLP